MFIIMMQALAAFQLASKYNPQSLEVSKKIKTLSQLAKDMKRAEELENMRSNVDMAKHFDTLKSELVSGLLHLFLETYLFQNVNWSSDVFSSLFDCWCTFINMVLVIWYF